MTVLILAADHDLAVDRVIDALDRRSVPVCRINTAWFPRQLRVAAELNGRRGDAAWAGGIVGPARTLDLGCISSVWFRGPEAYRFPAELSTSETHHANLEAKYGLGGVLLSIPALWVNYPSRAADAAYKPRQLAAAADSGLAVPESVVTNDPDLVRRFCHQGRTITKLLGASSIYEEGTRKIAYTRVVGPDDLADLRGVDTTVHLFQRWVPKAYEARVVVIGDRVTAVAIHAGSRDSYVDWRTDYDALRYEVIELPSDVSIGVRSLMTRLGLAYGALDFVISPDGSWTFLEINPGGQYGWLEAETGAPLTAELADLLAEGHTP